MLKTTHTIKNGAERHSRSITRERLSKNGLLICLSTYAPNMMYKNMQFEMTTLSNDFATAATQLMTTNAIDVPI